DAAERAAARDHRRGDRGDGGERTHLRQARLTEAERHAAGGDELWLSHVDDADERMIRARREGGDAADAVQEGPARGITMRGMGPPDGAVRAAERDDAV